MNTQIRKADANPWRNRPWLVGAVLMALAVFGGCALFGMNPVPANLDHSRTRASSDGLYRLSYTPSLTPIPINQLHTWTLHLETAKGQPINDAEIRLNGDMPQHGHGLPTKPVVTDKLGNGNYLVEGMKFQMAGWWVIDFAVTANGKPDKVEFNLILGR
jgi:hypothetical protein